LTLADIYRDATAVIDALCRDPDTTTVRSSVEVPLTAAHIQQLHKRRCDLLDNIGTDAEALDVIMAEIHANRRAVEALNRVFDAHSDTITR
jgi:hypothetical protein